MYCYDGIVYRIWSVSGVMFLLGVLCILVERRFHSGIKSQARHLTQILFISDEAEGSR